MQPPVVFLPGLLEPALIWKPTARALGLRHAERLLVDLPGHRPGDTARGTRCDLSEGAFLDRLADRIARKFCGRAAMIVGHSTGGMLAIELASRHPSRVDRLVLVNALLNVPRRSVVRDIRRALLSDGPGVAAFIAAWRLWLSSRATFRAGFLGGAVKSAPLPNQDLIYRQLRACDPMAVRACARWVTATDVTGELSDVIAPTLALIGRSDSVVPPVHQFEILRTAPNAHARLIDGGHLLFAEAPREVRRAIVNWRAAATTGAGGEDRARKKGPSRDPLVLDNNKLA